MAIVTGDRYLESLVKFVENQAGPLIEGTLVLKLNPVGLHYVQSRLEALAELESLLAGAPVDYLRAYVSDLGDHRALEQLRRILRLLTSLKVVSVLPLPARDPTPLSLLPFGRLKVLELRGCDLSTSAARGLLELRHTLEKIICHNSTDALRHVFASRIAEIKNSPVWNRLSFVSCACNGLLLMDESLQLLPVAEILDLSRNKFAKVDNLRKCTRLKHLDLGFNHLRTVSSLSEVSSHIVKLVLRNNALTTLRGIERLKSLEGLDLSYNIISNFFELEILADLPSLESLWLEGNPLCSASWYRAQVFSFFPHPEKLKLDEKHIYTEEFWKRQIIIASRQKRPASFGFYSPAKDYAELEERTNTKRKKPSRLANIECDGQSTFVCSDEESISCENEVQSKEENANSDEEADIVDLMNRIEFMKKERSSLWLQEFKEWMDQAPDNFVDGSKYNGDLLNHNKQKYLKNKRRPKHLGETSRYVSDSVQASGDESSTNILESENSFVDTSIGFSTQQYFDRIGEAASNFFMGHAGDAAVPVTGRIEPKQEHLKSYHKRGTESVNAKNFHHDSFAVPEGDLLSAKSSFTTLAAIDDIMESHSSSAFPGSPPHYQEDILHRRHNLEEEFLQLSAESYSVASSDSNTSYSEDDSAEFGSLIPQIDKSLTDGLSERSVDGHSSVDSYYDKRLDILQLTQNGFDSVDSCPEKTSGRMELRKADLSPQLRGNSFVASEHGGEIGRLVKQEANWLENNKCKRRTIKRVISLSHDNIIDDGTEPSHKLNGNLGVCRDDVEDELDKRVSHGSNFEKSIDKRLSWKNAITTSHTHDNSHNVSVTKSSSPEIDDFIVNYFNSNIADFGCKETCNRYVHCNCMLEEKSGSKESEVAVVLSSEQKLYMLIIDGRFDGSGNSLRLIGCHRIEDVKEVLVGLGLQVLRLCIERDATYMFITRSIEKSGHLLCLLDFFDSYAIKDAFLLRSLEQVQVELFERHVCGGSKMSIFQYSMVLFWHNNLEEDIWLSRSLFVLQGHLLVCIEDLLHFGSLSEDPSSSSYFSLDSCCSVVDILEMVLEGRESRCATLALKCATSKFCHSDMSDKDEEAAAALTKERPASVPLTWKLKWLSQDSLFKFVALLKAVHAAATTTSPLVVRYVS